jgi:hypothetical protein
MIREGMDATNIAIKIQILTTFFSAEIKSLSKSVSPNPSNDNPGREYLTGWRCSRGWKTISPPRGGTGRAW